MGLPLSTSTCNVMPLVFQQIPCLPINTLRKVQKIHVILRKSENTFSLLQWLSMGKQNLKHKKIKKTYITKIILHNYILYNGNPTYVETFPVDSGMPLIFTDFQHSTCCRPTSCWKICKYQSHP